MGLADTSQNFFLSPVQRDAGADAQAPVFNKGMPNQTMVITRPIKT